MKMRIAKTRVAAALACVGSFYFATSARAADIYTPVAQVTETVETASGWTFSFTPYFWAAGLSGDVASFGLPAVHADADFGNIWDNLDFAIMAIGEARYDRYSVFGDIVYTKLSNSADLPDGAPASSVSLSADTFAGMLGAGYALVDDDVARLEIVGGVRIWSVDTDLSFSGGALDGVGRNDGATWVDGLVGFRGNYSITPKIYLTGWGYVGAGEADLDWDVAAGIGYRFNDTFSAVAGYRALGVDYQDDGFEFNVVQQGPILGLVVRF